MTISKLSQLKFLNKEISLEKRRLASLRYSGGSVRVDGIGVVKKEDYAYQISMLEISIDAHIKECFALYNEINEFINSIDDSLLRMILSLRFISGLEWEQIALHIGGGTTSDSVRKQCERFIKRQNLR